MINEIALQVEGLTLRGVLHWPDDAAPDVPVALILHGFGSRSRCKHLEYIADTLRALGYATVQVDFSGHGQSDGDMLGMTVPRQVRQAEAMMAYIHQLPGVGRVLVVGHSQGGTVGTLVAGAHPEWVDGLILLAAAGHISLSCKAGALQDARFDPFHIPERVWMFNTELSGEYFRQGQTLTEYEHAAAYPGPVCLMHEEEDDFVPAWCAKHYHESFPHSELHLFEGNDHRFYNVTPEVLEIVRDFAARLLKK